MDYRESRGRYDSETSRDDDRATRAAKMRLDAAILSVALDQPSTHLALGPHRQRLGFTLRAGRWEMEDGGNNSS
jgi:hypothetical protein